MNPRVVQERLNGIDQLLAELRGLVGAGGGPTTGGPITTFVVDPTVVTPSGNVFATFATAVAAASSVSGPKTYEFRGAAPVIAAGTYAMGNDPITFQGVNSTNTSTLSIAAGASLTGNFNFTVWDLTLTYAGVTPFITAPLVANGIFNYRFNDANVTVTGGAPLVRVPAGAFGFVILENATSTLTGVGFDTTGNGGLFVSVLDSAAISANTLGNPAGTLGVNSNSPAATISLTQGSVPGGLVIGGNLTINSSTNNTKGPGGGSPAIQAGVATLVAGTQAAIIPATITAGSRIVLGVKTMTPGAGNLTVEYSALGADRVVGLSGAGGGFKVTALVAAGTINVLDTSLVDYVIIN